MTVKYTTFVDAQNVTRKKCGCSLPQAIYRRGVPKITHLACKSQLYFTSYESITSNESSCYRLGSHTENLYQLYENYIVETEKILSSLR